MPVVAPGMVAEVRLAAVLVAEVRLAALAQVPAARVMKLIRRGQDEGAFRTDLPMWWLIAVIHQVFHAAPADFTLGHRTDPSRMPKLMTESVLAMLRAPRPSR